MKNTILLISLLFIWINIFADEDDFTRKLPGNDLLQLITPEKFPTMDAVIILKEQSFLVQPTEVYYKGITIKGPQTVKTDILIVKLFNETAVKRYGSFEFEYSELFGDKIRNGFSAHVRVLKENGEILEMDEDEIKTIVSRESAEGVTLARKVNFRVPNLAAGDVLQIESQFVNVFNKARAAIFYFNERDFVLYSNLYITLPENQNFSIISIPEEKIGKPEIIQMSADEGTGETYFWSLKNLNEITDEAFSLSFEDRSILTGFVLDDVFENFRDKPDAWFRLVSNFTTDYVDEGDIEKEEIEKFIKIDTSVTEWKEEQIDSLYTSIKTYFKLTNVNSIYPQNENLKGLIEMKKADASDLSVLFYKILKSFKQKVNCVLLRDKREGIYEKALPTLLWFDRLGVEAIINGKQKIYDFDKSVASKYKTPWFLSDIDYILLHDDKNIHKKTKSTSSISNNIQNETHVLNIDSTFSVNENLTLLMQGSFEENLRNEFYSVGQSEVNDYFKELLLNSVMTNVDNLYINNFLDENEIMVKAKGSSQIIPEFFDSLIIITLKDIFLTKLKAKLVTPVRKSDVVFETPFQISSDWEITLPDGFGLNSSIEERTCYGPKGSNSTISFSKNQNNFRVFFNITFPERIIPINQYKDLVKFINTSITNLQQNIIFSKF